MNPRRLTVPSVVAAALAAGLAAPAAGGEKPPSLDEMLDLEPAGDSAPSRSRPATRPAGERAGKAGELPKPVRASTPKGAFRAAVREMRTAAERLDAGGEAVETQRLQDRIVGRLERVIAAAKQQQRGGRGGSSARKGGRKGQRGGKPRQRDTGGARAGRPGARPKGGKKPGEGRGAPGSDGRRAGSKPASGSGAKKAGPGSGSGSGPSGGEDGGAGSWAELPPRVREQLMQGMGENYSAVYRRLIERYYKRLADEASKE